MLFMLRHMPLFRHATYAAIIDADFAIFICRCRFFAAAAVTIELLLLLLFAIMPPLRHCHFSLAADTPPLFRYAMLGHAAAMPHFHT